LIVPTPDHQTFSVDRSAPHLDRDGVVHDLVMVDRGGSWWNYKVTVDGLATSSYRFAVRMTCSA
jgi:hypothetical protein